MTTTRMLLFLSALLAFPPGCGGLLSKGEAGNARYFSLDQASAPSDDDRVARAGQGDGANLRLGRVTSANHLEDRLVYRDSPHEIGYHRELRWTAPPEEALRRQLARELFEVRGVGHAVGGDAPTLDVQLTALDEVRLPQHLARAQLTVTLRSESVVYWEQTLTVDRPIVVNEGDDPPLVTVAALGAAMRGAIERVAERVVGELQARR